VLQFSRYLKRKYYIELISLGSEKLNTVLKEGLNLSMKWRFHCNNKFSLSILTLLVSVLRLFISVR